MTEYDLIIVGAGPAGAAAALHAHRLGLRCALLDKATFPRDKTCGDGLSGRSVKELHELGLLAQVRQLPGARIHRVVFTAPDGSVLDVDLRHHQPPDPSAHAIMPLQGAVIRRRLLDSFLFGQAAAVTAECHQGFAVRDVQRTGDLMLVTGQHADSSSRQFRGRIVLGCDGFSSIVARCAGLYRREANHRMVAIRQYMQGVAGLRDQIELHFTEALTPGYLWIFPAGEGLANVGLGADWDQIRRHRLDLRAALDRTIHESPFGHRFARARAVSRVAGWNLPVGSVRRPCCAAGVMLLGDAAGLVDPFTGEGIGNALVSARAAVSAAATALAAGSATAAALRPYAEHLWAELGPELTTSTRLHRLSRCRPLLSWVIRRAGASDGLGRQIGGMMAGTQARSQLLRPSFYLKLLLS